MTNSLVQKIINDQLEKLERITLGEWEYDVSTKMLKVEMEPGQIAKVRIPNHRIGAFLAGSRMDMTNLLEIIDIQRQAIEVLANSPERRAKIEKIIADKIEGKNSLSAMEQKTPQEADQEIPDSHS